MAGETDRPEGPPQAMRPSGAQAPAPPVVTSDVLLAGRRELIIRHGHEEYRLRVTGNNKLILTK